MARHHATPPRFCNALFVPSETLGKQLAQEQLRVVLLDTKHRILGTRTVYQGSVN